MKHEQVILCKYLLKLRKRSITQLHVGYWKTSRLFFANFCLSLEKDQLLQILKSLQMLGKTCSLVGKGRYSILVESCFAKWRTDKLHWALDPHLHIQSIIQPFKMRSNILKQPQSLKLLNIFTKQFRSRSTLGTISHYRWLYGIRVA